MKWFCYIKFEENESYALTSGVEFRTFASGLKKKPKNILTLSGYMNIGKYNDELMFQCIPEKDIENFFNYNVESFGDFHWIDYRDEKCLQDLTGQEKAELLYLFHFGKPLNGFQFSCLGNQYAYIAHDDDYYTKIYMQDISEYLPVLSQKVTEELKGRKRSLPPLPDEVCGQLYQICKKGVIFDFEHSLTDKDECLASIYEIGDFNGFDNMHREFDRKRETLNAIATLAYYSRKKKWELIY